MKVLYDYQAFDMQSHGGVTRCFAELYRHRPASLDAEISVLETDNAYLQNIGFKKTGDVYRNFLWRKDSDIKRFLFKLYYNIKYGYYSKWDRKPDLNVYDSVSKIRKGDYDVLHPTFFFSYFLAHLGNKPFVITVHDMIPELFPEYFASDDIQIVQKQVVIPKAAHIVAVSEHTKNDLIRLMGIPEDRVSVIYHGADEEPYNPSSVISYDYEYILFVGDRQLYKNFKSFCCNCAPILKRHHDLMVICTGKPFTKDEISFLETLGVRDCFINIFVQTTQELMDLYHNAVAFVYPSEYEGFGIPILEAYKADCPVMLNHASCFPEIAGDAAIYFDMKDDRSDFEEQFETLYHMDGNERMTLLEKQRVRLQRYSWKKSAKALADVYAKLV